MNSPATVSAALPVAAASAKRAGNQALMIIAVFKLVKALLFFAVAFGLLHMLHRDTEVELRKLLHVFRIDGDRGIFKTLLGNAKGFEDREKLVTGILAAFSGAMFCTEGVGLLLRKKWAEYFTVILTSCGIPIELYEIFHRTAGAAHERLIELVPEEQRAAFVFDKMMMLKIAALLLNSLIVWFLIVHLRRQRIDEERDSRAALPSRVGETSEARAGLMP